MLIISDTNILSSLAAADALSLLFHLFPNRVIYIPPAVQQELQAGLERQRTYLEAVLDAITENQLQILTLSAREQQLAQQLPKKLNLGEREAIALTQNRRARLLSNDKRAIRYCQTHQLKVVNLVDLLRLLWTRRVVSRFEVEQIITRMEQVETLVLSEADRARVFASRRHRRRKP